MATVLASSLKGQVPLHDRAQNMQFFLGGVATGQVTPLEHAGTGRMVSCQPTTKDISVVVNGLARVFIPKGSVWIPESLHNHFYLKANGVVTTP